MRNSRACLERVPSRLTAVKPEVAIPVANQKDRRLWERLNYVKEDTSSMDTREKRSAHACLSCFWREFAFETISDTKSN